MVFLSLELRPLPQFPAYNRKIHRAPNGAVEFRHERSQPHRIPASIGHQRNTYSIFKGNRHVLKQPPEFLCDLIAVNIAQINIIPRLSQKPFARNRGQLLFPKELLGTVQANQTKSNNRLRTGRDNVNLSTCCENLNCHYRCLVKLNHVDAKFIELSNSLESDPCAP